MEKAFLISAGGCHSTVRVIVPIVSALNVIEMGSMGEVLKTQSNVWNVSQCLLDYFAKFEVQNTKKEQQFYGQLFEKF